MAITVPQTNKGDFTSAQASLAVAFASGIAAGSIIVVGGSHGSGPSSITLSDGHSDTVTDSGQGLFTDSGNGVTSWFKAFFSPVTGAQTITVTYNGGNPSFGDMFIWEVAGLTSAQFDKVVHASGSALPSDSGASGTLSSSNEACFSIEPTSGTNTASPGTGWTSDGITTNTTTFGEHIVVSVNTSIHAINNGAAPSWTQWFASVMSGGGDVLAASPGLRFM